MKKPGAAARNWRPGKAPSPVRNPRTCRPAAKSTPMIRIYSEA